MSGNRIAENNEFSIQNLARSIQAYLEYRIVLDRKYSLKEASIDEPFTAYINQHKDSAELECALNYFKEQRCDAVFKLKKDIQQKIDIPYYLEFKYTQGQSSRHQAEKQRVFDDLMRLNSIDTSGAKKYFMMVGASIDFFQDFQYCTPYVKFPTKSKPCPLRNINFQLSSLSGLSQHQTGSQNVQLVLSCANSVIQANPVTLSSSVASPCPINANFVIECPLPNISSPQKCTLQRFNSNNVYNEMFSFDISNPDRIIDTSNQRIADLIDKGNGKDGFKNSYRASCIKKDIPGGAQEYTNFIDKIKHIKTTLQYITHNDSLARVAIWEITSATP